MIACKAILMLILGASLMIPVSTAASERVSPVDSLQKLLKNTRDVDKRAIINVHLADIYTGSVDISNMYWDNALTEALNAKNDYVAKLALDKLVERHAEADMQKVDKYISIAQLELTEKKNELFRSFLFCYKIWYEMRKLNNLQSLESELIEMRNDSSRHMSPEAEIQREYLMGISQDFSSTLTGSYKKVPDAIPYIERALKKLLTFPLQDRIYFEMLCRFELSELYLVVGDKRAVNETEKIMELHEQLKHLNTPFKRPFLDDSSFYIKMYSHMIFLTNLLPKEKSTEYYHKYMKLAIQKNKMDDIYENSARYYATIGDYKKAITYIDSVMQYGKYRQQQLLPIYVVKSILYSKMGDYKNAYLTIRERLFAYFGQFRENFRANV